MDISKDLYQRITTRHGTTLDLEKNPGILEDILREMRSMEHDDFSDHQKKTASPFNVPWMDSWAANWLLHQQASSAQAQGANEFNSVFRQLIDLKLRDRLSELKRFIRYAEPPDGGPPEPGTPPAGPYAFASPTPPPDDFRSPTPPPEPGDQGIAFSSPTPPPPGLRSSTSRPNPFGRAMAGVPEPEPPDGGTPEPGVPNPPPDPGPDPGPDAGMLRENPWILYWFVSINAPLILDMIDAHITRRLNDIKMQTHGK